MFPKSTNKPLSRRASKMLVEMVIGVIGILGIMIAQVGNERSALILQTINESGEVVYLTTQTSNVNVDWLDILF